MDEFINDSSNGDKPKETQTYLLTDHLGSVTTTVEGTANLVGKRNYDSFGRRRSGTDWQSAPAAVNAGKHGYTDHEDLEKLNLVHMAGRVYDPNIGKFTSVDPVFQAPTNTQSVNPYSYVMNNPLSLVDPSGYCGSTTVDADDNTSGTGDCKQDGDTKTATARVTPLGTHITSKITVTQESNGDVAVSGNTAGARQDIKNGIRAMFGGGNGVTNGSTGMNTQKGNNASASADQGANDQRNNLSTAAGSGDTIAMPENITVTATGADKSAIDSGTFTGDVSLTDAQKQTVLGMAENPYSPSSPTEAFQIIRNNNSQTDRSIEGCIEVGCPAFKNAIEVHWHVFARELNGLTQSQANISREFPGSGDHVLLGYNTVNVGVTPMGAVWAIQRVNGVVSLDYLKHSSNERLDNFIKANWTPGMSDSQIYDLVRRFDH